jgi:hypothetical protein
MIERLTYTLTSLVQYLVVMRLTSLVAGRCLELNRCLAEELCRLFY